MSPKPWREIAVPHKDVLQGSFQQAEFAADISRVHAGTATDEYQDAALFFQRTYITEGMRLLLDSVVRRLSGQSGDPVIQLQTAFGGGKTHTMLAVLHLASGGASAERLAGVPAILQQAGVRALPKTRLAVLDGTKLSPNQPRIVEGRALRTLWGELAWQLGGAGAYARVAESDTAGTAPGKDVLASLIGEHAPCVILVDELVAYVRQFEPGRTYTGGSYDSNLSFVQALTEALKAVPNALMLASLPESDQEAGGGRGVAALRALEHYFGRVQAIWKPVGAEESFEIVRRRLFASIDDGAAVEAVCRAFADLYVAHAGELPSETQESHYLERMRRAYPIHPEVFERLYKDWSALPNFQRTRGVLKLMARAIHRLWQDNNADLLILPGSLPIYDPAFRGELGGYLPAGWDPVLESDVDGPRSEPAQIETREPKFGGIQACRRVTRTIFLGSAPSSVSDLARGIETERVVLGCLQPDQAPHLFRDALGRLENRLTYLNKGNNRWWLDVRPNLRREMEERKRRFSDEETVGEIKAALGRVMLPGIFEGVHLFAQAADVPDDWGLRLAALPPNAPYGRNGHSAAQQAANRILRTRGEQPRIKQNRLLFLAADGDQVMYLRETARTLLAWRSITSDIRDLRLNLDILQTRQAEQNQTQARDTLLRLVREAYKWLLVPAQQARSGGISEVEWEAYPLNPATKSLSQEIESVLTEHEIVIREWAPLHLHRLMSTWFWKPQMPYVSALKVWQDCCSYLYLPRLLNSHVMQATIGIGVMSRDFFALAQAVEGETYRGFVFATTTVVLMDTHLLIEPVAAETYDAAHRKAEATTSVASGGQGTTASPEAIPMPSGATDDKPTRPQPKRFYGTMELPPDSAGLRFAEIASEIIEHFTAKSGTRVRIRVDIEAVHDDGFDQHLVRTVRENGRTLRFVDLGFED